MLVLAALLLAVVPASVPEAPVAVAVVDDSGLLTVSVPDGWTVETAAGESGVPQIRASSTGTFEDDWAGGRVTYSAALAGDGGGRTWDTAAALDDKYATTCLASGFVTPYARGEWTGHRRDWVGCGPSEDAAVTTIAAVPADGSMLVTLTVQTVGSGVDPAVDLAVLTFGRVAPSVGDSVPGSSAPGSSVPGGAIPTLPAAPAGMTQVMDDLGVVTAAVPEAWVEVEGVPETESDGTVLAVVQASSSLDGYRTSWDVPGVSVGAMQTEADTSEVVGQLDYSMDCDQSGPVEPIELPGGSGHRVQWAGCGDAATLTLVAVTEPATGALLIASITTLDDPTVIDPILQSVALLG